MNLTQLKKLRKGKTLSWLQVSLRLPWVSFKIELSLPAKVYEVHRYRYPHESEEEAMRSDWAKIGGDFRVSIAKAERETATE